MAKLDSDILWYDRKRTFLGLPWSFTRYSLSSTRLFVKTGFLSLQEEETLLYRILDITLSRTFGQRLLGLGTIRLITADKTSPEQFIRSVKKSDSVKTQLSKLVEEARTANRVYSRELFDEDQHDHTLDPH